MPPQPFDRVPQVPAGQAVGVQQVLLGRQTLGGGQVPQLVVPPHPSLMLPHTWLAEHWAGLQHWLFRQTPLPGQGPQSSWPPHPSLTAPHWAPASPQVRAVHGTHTLAAPVVSQISPEAQDPQLRVPPQPSDLVPHSCPALEHVDGRQHALPRQTSPAVGQVPQSTWLPQPSLMLPHSAISLEQLRGMHGTHTFAVPVVSQTSPLGHWPQSS